VAIWTRISVSFAINLDLLSAPIRSKIFWPAVAASRAESSSRSRAGPRRRRLGSFVPLVDGVYYVVDEQGTERARLAVDHERPVRRDPEQPERSEVGSFAAGRRDGAGLHRA
jgi:hypothetical protein